MRNYRSIELPSVDGGIGRVTTQAAANRDPQGMLYRGTRLILCLLIHLGGHRCATKRARLPCEAIGQAE